jgi:very-short-patch-repair endonuclease
MINLKEICSKIDDKRYMISLSLNKDIRQQIELETQWMNGFYSLIPLKIRCLTINRGFSLENFPRCPVCNSPVAYDKAYQNKFNQFCSDGCSKSHGRLSIERKRKLEDYQWLYNERITNQKSIEDIATELGCSISPVKKYIKYHNIPHVKYNESSSLAKSFLKNKDWLEQKHKVEKKRLNEIAAEIGSSGSTVSIWMQRHGIICNDPNSYDRKNNMSSKQSLEVRDFLVSNGIEVKENDRQILSGYELDFISEKHKIAIEYNGLYSHIFRPEVETFSGRKDQNYHISKTNKAKLKGYEVLHIFSDDWVNPNKQNIWKSILRYKFGKIDKKIYARKCSVREVKTNEKNIFLDKNHLQGKDKSKIKLGLYLDDELVSLMTFGKSRYNKNYEWELIRFASITDHIVVGGFSKLLNYFMKLNTGSIISYADYSRSNGKVYENNGFTKIKQNPPSYWYVNFNNEEKRIHRSNFMKFNLTNKDDKRTEEEIMVEKGYHRIWDCGTIAYGINRS